MDENFFSHIRSKFKTFDSWRHTKVSQYTTLVYNWEQAKRNFSGKEAGMVSVEMARAVSKAVFDIDDDDEDNEGGFTKEQLSSFFDPVVDNIITLIEAQLAIAPAVQAIFLVGGFSSSPYLRQRILRRYKGVKDVYAFSLSAEAIVIGAAMIGMFPAALESRCAKHTYGLQSARPAQQGDPQDDIHMIDGSQLCLSCFDAFVQAGQELPESHSVEKSFAFCRA